MAAKCPTIRLFLEAVAAEFGPDTFPLDEKQPEVPEHVVLTSARDRRFSASVIARPERPGYFSVMVELHDPPEPQLIPFEIAADGVFSLAEVLGLLARYREWRQKS
jgi:hypothetical protein